MSKFYLISTMFRVRPLKLLFNRFDSISSIKSLSTSSPIYQHAKEVIKIVNPYSKIKVNCNCNLKILPYDLLDCPDSNILRASVNSTSDHKLNITIKGNDVIITDSGSTPTLPVSCILEIPVKANLEVSNKGSTSISDLYSDEVRVESDGNIETKSLRCTLVDLKSSEGSIFCGGTTLAQIIKIVTTGKGNVLLDKLQGGDVEVETNSGDISVNCSYSNNSCFKTNHGNLLLKSIHKLCHVSTAGSGRFIMNGFYGTLNANVASHEVSLQLSEIVGVSTVTAKSANLLDLAVSDTVCDNTEINITCNRLEAEPGITGDQTVELNDAGHVTVGNKDTDNKLKVQSAGLVTLRKMSWADTFKFNIKNV